MSSVMRMTIGLVFFLIFMPVVLWLTIAAVADASDYLALMRSGFLLLGLGLGIGWGLFRNSPRLVLLGLGLAILGYITFTGASNFFFGVSDFGYSLHEPLASEIRLGFDQQVVPGFPFGHFAAIVMILANAVMAWRRLPLRRMVVNNLIISTVILIAATALGAC